MPTRRRDTVNRIPAVYDRYTGDHRRKPFKCMISIAFKDGDSAILDRDGITPASW